MEPISLGHTFKPAVLKPNADKKLSSISSALNLQPKDQSIHLRFSGTDTKALSERLYNLESTHSHDIMNLDRVVRMTNEHSIRYQRIDQPSDGLWLHDIKLVPQRAASKEGLALMLDLAHHLLQSMDNGKAHIVVSPKIENNEAYLIKPNAGHIALIHSSLPSPKKMAEPPVRSVVATPEQRATSTIDESTAAELPPQRPPSIASSTNSLGSSFVHLHADMLRQHSDAYSQSLGSDYTATPRSDSSWTEPSISSVLAGAEEHFGFSDSDSVSHESI